MSAGVQQLPTSTMPCASQPHSGLVSAPQSWTALLPNQPLPSCAPFPELAQSNQPLGFPPQIRYLIIYKPILYGNLVTCICDGTRPQKCYTIK